MILCKRHRTIQQYSAMTYTRRSPNDFDKHPATHRKQMQNYQLPGKGSLCFGSVVKTYAFLKRYDESDLRARNT